MVLETFHLVTQYSFINKIRWEEKLSRNNATFYKEDKRINRGNTD